MWKTLKVACLTTALFAGTSLMAYAQMSTVDPGRGGSAAPSQLGPSTGSPAAGGNGVLGAGDAPHGNWSGAAPGAPGSPTGGTGSGSGTTVYHGTPGTTTGTGGATGTMPSTGTSSSGFGAGSGAGLGGSPTGNGPSGAGGSSAIGGGR